MRKGILIDKKVVPCNNLLEWAHWFESANRHVGQDTVGQARVSTVFLGMDHGYWKETPLWFETMIFGGKNAQFQERYATYEEAEAGHKRVVEALKKGEKL